MNKAKIVVGLDAGSHSLKVAELKEHKGGLALKQAGIISLQGDPSSTPLQTAQAVSKRLGSLLSSMKIKNASVITSVPGHSVLIRLLKLPPIPEGKIEEVIQYEAQQQVPFALDEVVWDYFLLKRKKILEMEVLLVAIKVDLIKEARKKIDEHLSPGVIDVSPLALYNCVRYNKDYLSEDHGVVIIDIGAESTDIVIFKQEDVWTRSFPIGGNNFTRVLQKEFGLSSSEAERIKKGGLKGYPQEEVKRVIKPVLEDLVVEIQHAVGYFRNQIEGLTIGEAILSGGGSQLPALNDVFREALGVEVRNINPFKRIKREPQAKILVDNKWGPIQPYEHLLGVAVGLALRQQVKCSVEINLLSREISEKKIVRRQKGYMLFGIAGLLFLLGGVTLFLHLHNSVLRKRAETVRSEYESEYEIFKPEIERMRARGRMIAGRNDVLERIVAGRILPRELLRACGQSIPRSVYLREFSYPENSQRSGQKELRFLFLKGQADSFDRINEFIKDLPRVSPYITRAEPLDSSSRQTGEGELIDFSLEAELAGDLLNL